MKFLQSMFSIWEKIKDALFALFLLIMALVFLASSISFYFEGDFLYGSIHLMLLLMTSLFIKPAFSELFSNEEKDEKDDSINN